MPLAPGQNPTLLTSCEYASWVILSAPGRPGALRPENRVTAKSKLPQKKCTGLDFPIKRDLNWLKIASTDTRMRQNFSTDSGSYDACTRSWSNAMGLGISTGMRQILTLM